jgi:hypothetical protein
MTNLMRKMKRKVMMMRLWLSKLKPRREQLLLLQGEGLQLAGVGPVGELLPGLQGVEVLLKQKLELLRLLILQKQLLQQPI